MIGQQKLDIDFVGGFEAPKCDQKNKRDDPFEISLDPKKAPQKPQPITNHDDLFFDLTDLKSEKKETALRVDDYSKFTAPKTGNLPPPPKTQSNDKFAFLN